MGISNKSVTMSGLSASLEKNERMKLELLNIWPQEDVDRVVRVEPAGLKRKWMDDTSHQYAYRCLPLNVANQHGWSVYPNSDIILKCNENTDGSAEHVKILKNQDNVASSHFGFDTFTFSIPFLVRTPPGYSLWIGGAPNHKMKHVQPLTGIYETDWSPYSFTMNWVFTTYNQNVVFTPNDPLMFFFPIKRDNVKEFELERKQMEEDPETAAHFREWNDMRNSFNADTDRPPELWMKHYFSGKYPNGSKCPIHDHTTKLKLR